VRQVGQAMNARKLALLALLLIGALVAMGAFVERSRRGIEISYMSFAVLLWGPAFRLWLVARGRIEPTPLPALLISLLAFVGLYAYPFSPWALTTGAIGTFWLALPVEGVGASRTTRIEEIPVAILAVGVPLWAMYKRIDVGDTTNYVLLIVFVCLGLESCGPKAEHTVEAASRRVSAFAIVLATAIVNTPGEIVLPHGIIGRPSADLLALGAIAVITACVEKGEQSQPTA